MGNKSHERPGNTMAGAIHRDQNVLITNLAKPVKITTDNIFGLPDNRYLTQMIF